MNLTILIADDHALFRAGLKTMLNRQKNFQVVGEADSGIQVVEKAKKFLPDVIIMDISMPGKDGITATREVLKISPRTRIIGLSIHGGKRFVGKMLQAGASGYVLKDNAPEEIIQAVNTVSKGRQYLSPEVTGLIITQYVNLLSKTQSDSSTTALLDIEKEFILFIGDGMSLSEAAKAASLTYQKAERLQTGILEKLGLSSQHELIEYIGVQKWFAGNLEFEETLRTSVGAHTPKEGTRSNAELLEPLTNREMDILELLDRRLYNKEIAVNLGISIETVKTHVKHIFQKLNATNRREAITKAAELKLLKEP